VPHAAGERVQSQRRFPRSLPGLLVNTAVRRSPGTGAASCLGEAVHPVRESPALDFLVELRAPHGPVSAG
jgi:hypothetical protein